MHKLAALSAIAVMMVATSTADAKSKTIYTHDFLTATHIVGRYYGQSVENWLVSCSSSEGSHGGWVWRDHTPPVNYGNGKREDKPGGWMQFFASTFYSNLDWAWQDALHRGLRADGRARNYYEPLGQAIVAGAMYRYHGNPGTWTGSRC